MVRTLAVVAAVLGAASGINPYEPTAGWLYALEAAGRAPWPDCPNRFLSVDNACTQGSVALDSSTNSPVELIPAPQFGPSNSTFFIKLHCGKFLSYAGPCAELQVDAWPAPGINQAFRFAALAGGDGTAFGWSLEAVGRASCPEKFVNFPSTCGGRDNRRLSMSVGNTTQQRSAEEAPKLTASATPGLFRLQVLGAVTPMAKDPNSQGGCADPFAWRSVKANSTYMVCTGGGLELYTVANHGSLAPSTPLVSIGVALGGQPPEWAASGNRWAPENLEVDGHNFIFVADDANGPHRIGWVRSDADVAAGSWQSYSPSSLDLGQTRQGEIDAHVFRDTDGKVYLLWKTDDNSIGLKTTRLWAQQINVSASTVELLGSPRLILDSTGMWWVTSFINGGTLIEAPEVVKLNNWYYLFFAGGRFCQDSYSEGVARSKSIWGPYEKMQSPLLTTALVGASGSNKIIGPGHASFVQAPDNPGNLHIVYAASVGENCNRMAFVERLRINTATGWPYVDFA
eukprot:m.469221 g.469221  ORF g.469221 m.469221 type:complete len:512 (-) comp28285_c0_seq1:210-1745(-)